MKIIIDGDPVPQARMRLFSRNGLSRVYDPNQRDKTKIKGIIRDQFVASDLFIHPRVSFVFHMSIPTGVPKRLLSAYRSGFLRHEKKPDIDNFIKLYFDCLDDICFDGDQRVSLGHCVKVYHPHPKTIISIIEMQEIVSLSDVDDHTWDLLNAQ